MLPFRTILIDDEPLALNRLRRLLGAYADTITIVGEATNGADGLKAIEILNPDVIFLDIEMPVLNGFEMLAQLNHLPMVVFATAYDAYAVRAFDENSVDYLLKPIEPDRLARTIDRLKKAAGTAQSMTATPANTGLLQLLEQMRPKKEMHSISVKSGDRILLIPLSDVAYFEADSKYVLLHTLDGQQYLTNYTISTLEEKLPEPFIRVSRSTLLNSHHIREVQRHLGGKYIVILRDKKASQHLTGSAFQDSLRELLNL